MRIALYFSGVGLVLFLILYFVLSYPKVNVPPSPGPRGYYACICLAAVAYLLLWVTGA